ncbi:unnamed protein product [Porites lobata]|uniref:Large ribosomal subunit protein bL21m n=1 Tax=Porites lobata TaxID=104759 RepID=A0ABN8MSY0_9CNID|nr:unnamed protein product [Porites lobata]
MASRSALRCANLLRATVTRSGRKSTVDGLYISGVKLHKFQGVHSNSMVACNLVKNSFKTYTTTALVAAQLSAISPLGLLGNVDVRSLSNGPATSLTEAGGEEDDEQNCPPSSDVIKDVQDEMLKSGSSGHIFAVVHIGGRQFKITINDTIVINRIDADTGERIHIEKVLMVGGENFSVIGTPLVARDLARIEATVVEKTKSPKVIVFKKKRRKGYKRTQGHRQDITVLRINSIHVQPELLSLSTAGNSS